MKYSDMSREQKLARGDEWVKVLDTYCKRIHLSCKGSAV